MTARTTQPWVSAATLDDVWEGELIPVDVGGQPIVLANIGGEIVAFEDRCPHLASRLSDGTFDGHTLVCAAHEWVFDCSDGTGVNPTDACLQRFAVRVQDEMIFVNVDEVLQQRRGLPGLGDRR